MYVCVCMCACIYIYIYIHVCMYALVYFHFAHMRMWKQKAKNENTGEARLRRALISARRNLLPLARTFSKMDFQAYFMCRMVQALQSHIGCCKYGFIANAKVVQCIIGRRCSQNSEGANGANAKAANCLNDFL